MTGDTGKGLAERLPLVAAAAFIALLPITKIADPDLFFHLRLGEYVWENRALYWTDQFSYTALGSPQNTGEWLANGLIYGAYKLAGFYGVGLLKSALFLAAAFLVYKALRAPGNEGRSAPLALSLLVFALAMRFRLDLRPYYFTYVFLSAFLFVVLRHRESGKGLYALPLLQVLWSNTHGGSILGPMLVGLFAASEAARTRRFPVKPAVVFALVLLASWLNPEVFREAGGGGAGAVGRFNPLGASELGEWQPLTRHLLWGFGMRYTLGYQLLAAGAALFLIAEAARKRFDFFYIALFAASVVFPLKHVRLIPEASILLMPMFYGFLRGAHGLLPGAARSGLAALVLAAAMALLVAQSVFRSPYYSFGFGPKDEVLQDGALRFLDEQGIGGNGFNTVTVGSYMLWRAPHRKTFIDGRLLQPADVQLLYDMSIDSADWLKEADRRYGLNYIVLDYDPKAIWRFPFHVNKAPEWALVYWDRASAVYVKNNEANAALIRGRGYRLLRPNFDDFSYLDPHLGSDRGSVLALIEEDIKKNPALQDPYLAKAYASYYLGMRDEALVAIEQAHRLPPDTAFEHVSAALLLAEAGRRDEAVRQAGAALKVDPRNEDARQLLERLGE